MCYIINVQSCYLNRKENIEGDLWKRNGDPLSCLRRFNEWRAEHAQSLEKAKEQGIEQGIEQGRAEAYQADCCLE